MGMGGDEGWGTGFGFGDMKYGRGRGWWLEGGEARRLAAVLD